MSTVPPRPRRRVQQAFLLSSRSLGTRVVAGAGYKLTGTAVRVVLTIGSTAILARLLSPADYGYIAMATIVTELAALFATAGITDTLVQRRRITRIQLDTAFWSLLAIGTVLGGIVALVSGASGSLFGDPAVAPYMLALGLLFPLNSLAAVPNVLLVRLLDFRAEFHIGIATLLLRSVAAILAARGGLGPWSLVIGAYTGAVVTVLLTFAAYPFLPRLRFSVGYLLGSWRVSSLYLSAGLVYYVNMNADLLLVSRYWGAAPLGLYQNARALADELRARLAAPLAQTLFPAFSAVQTDAAHMTDLFFRATRVLASVILLMSGVLAVTAEEVVELLYGPRWQAMVPLLSLFALGAGLRGTTALASPLLNAANRPGFVLKHHVIGTLLMVAAVVATLRLGIEAVTAAVALSTLYSLVPYAVAVRTFGFDVKHVLHLVGGPVIALLACLAAGTLLRHLVPWAEHGPHARFVLFALASGVIYVLVLALVAREHLQELRRLIQRLTRRHER